MQEKKTILLICALLVLATAVAYEPIRHAAGAGQTAQRQKSLATTFPSNYSTPAAEEGNLRCGKEH